MTSRRPQFSWESAKSRQSTELLDAIPSLGVFEALRDRTASLTMQPGEGAGMPASAEAIARAHEQLGQFDKADALLARTRSSEVEAVARTIWRARLQTRRGRLATARLLLDKRLTTLNDDGEEGARSALLTELALLDLADGSTTSVLDRLDRAFSLGRAINSVSAKAHALSAVGLLYTVEPASPAQAIEILNRAALLHQRSGDRAALGRTYNNIGVVLHQKGSFVQAIPYLELGLEFSALTPDLLTVINSLNNNIRAYEMYYMEAASHLREVLVPLVTQLGASSMPRLSDLTMPPVGVAVTDARATFGTDPIVAEVFALA